MKFKPETGDFPLDQDSCKADYTRARELGRVRLGQRALYFSHLTWTGVLPLDQVERAYLRIEDIPVGMGCRRVPMGQHYLMAVLRNGETRKAAVNSRQEGDWALEQIQRQAPEIKIGYVPPAPGEAAP